MIELKNIKKLIYRPAAHSVYDLVYSSIWNLVWDSINVSIKRSVRDLICREIDD